MTRSAALLVALALAAPAAAQDAPSLGDVASVLQWARTRAAAMPSAAIKAPKLPDDPWRRVTLPSKGRAQAIGEHDAGCLAGAAALPLSGTGYQVMRPSRLRYFGHPVLLAYLRGLAGRVSAAGFGQLMIGDLAQPRGGPTLSGHASHQTGLDVDVWYRRWPAGAPMGEQQRETLSTPSLVVPDFERLAPNWDPTVIELLKLAASDAAVERIFVNPVIKEAVCAGHAGEAWVGKLRPWWGHDDHFHARLSCPAGDPACRSVGDPVPPGDGCGAPLDFWLTPERKEQARRDRTEPGKPPTMPHLPRECAAVLKS